MEQNFIHHLSEPLPPTILTIFGATGDLSSDYLLPALLHMDSESLLPKDFRLLCVGRRNFTAEQYLDFIIKKSSSIKRIWKADKRKFLKKLIYFQGDFEQPQSFGGLPRLFEEGEKKGSRHACYNRLYYLATGPEYFGPVARILQNTGLLRACQDHNRKIRVLIEKPFGTDLESSIELNRLLLEYFSEDQIYRIDHYQGKETVQNLMVVRFANSIFEPLWNKDYIEHIEISVLEQDDARSRVHYYDKTGALKDMVQNHILQMLSLITMNEPRELTADYIRDEKLKVIEALQPFTFNDFSPSSQQSLKKKWVVRAQYDGYEKQAKKGSNTETYVAMKVFINSPRWRDVPIFLRTGKALGHKVAEISVHFRENLRCLFRGCSSNVLTFRIQPDESVHLRVNNKIPGFGVQLHQGDYKFGYDKAFVGEIPSAYERLLLDFLEGDQRLFIRSDEIEAAWKFVDSIRASWQDLPLHSYRRKSLGPKAAQMFMEKEGRKWQTK